MEEMEQSSVNSSMEKSVISSIWVSWEMYAFVHPVFGAHV